ncbi:outer membrane beta-barrel family protein [Tannerella sp.]|uniref:outer membrane beta-barrel family protein n=1 Tax=Tannerella sp. TaxID=2382127 RepID=UPI0026DCB847|nr:outer membrane beta-barrel family protein [Tannerella sp.]MDO4704340.1 outer membrane beta-barrel family protein [Tannerella sp.]
MKRFLIVSIASVIFAGFASAQERSGKVTDNSGRPVEFATVALLTEDGQAAVTVTDTLGRFSLTAVGGKYRINIRHLAYQPLEQSIDLSDASSKVGDFRLNDLRMNLDEVTITASAITREADRFVMRMNTPLTLNKDATEILQLAPGVWVDDNGISINGTRGAKVFINERELRLKGKELMSYLRNFRSADIVRIEIIPQTGAEYSADSFGGVIKLTLRRQLENGISGHVKVGTAQSKKLADYQPSASLNARTGHWTFSTFASGKMMPKGKTNSMESYNFRTGGNHEHFSASHVNRTQHSGLGRLGIVYEPDTRNSFGVEAEYSALSTHSPSSVSTRTKPNGILVRSESDYRQKEADRTYSMTLNYVHALDTLGSTFKVIADYTNKYVEGDNDYHTLFARNGKTSDSVYRNNTSSHYRIYTADGVLSKQLWPRTKLVAGVKYTHNDMSDTVRHESLRPSGWQLLPAYHYSLGYTENIGAVYGTFSAEYNRLSLVAGLRGEYTHANGHHRRIRQSYFDLFPNLNVTYSFDPMRIFMLIGQYSRNIERPNFRRLHPNRIQYSEYSYYIGNPALRPTYIHKIGLTAVYRYRYVLSVGANLHRDLVREVRKTETSDPNVTYIIPENHHTENHYYVVLSAPLRPTKWWNLNVNLVGVKQDIRGTENDRRVSHYLYFANVTTGVSLPAKFHLELTYSGTSRLYSANSGIEPRHLFHLSVKKQLLNDRLTASLGINNVFDRKIVYFSEMARFTTRTKVHDPQDTRYFKFSLNYTFSAGKHFKSRALESSSQTEKDRLKRTPDTR